MGSTAAAATRSPSNRSPLATLQPSRHTADTGLPPAMAAAKVTAGPRMKPFWLLLKNLIYVLVVPGVIAGWFPLRVFERWPPRWPALWNWPQWTGAVLALLGTVVFLHCVWVFAIRGQGTPAFFDPPRKLTKRGPFKWVRNPMYLALFALVAGEALFFRSWHIGVYLVCLVCALHLLVVLHEERELRFRHGAVYEDYKREVGRWLPRKPRPITETAPPFDVRR